MKDLPRNNIFSIGQVENYIQNYWFQSYFTYTLFFNPSFFMWCCFVYSFNAFLEKFRINTLSLPASEEQVGRDLPGKGVGERAGGRRAGWLETYILLSQLCSYVVCLFVCLFACLFVCWLVGLFACLLVCLFACLLACLFVCLFVCLSISLVVAYLGTKKGQRKEGRMFES